MKNHGNVLVHMTILSALETVIVYRFIKKTYITIVQKKPVLVSFIVSLAMKYVNKME